jgi:uncharacterized protein (TIGR03437 family)
MNKAFALTIICLCRLASQAATFGTVVPVTGGATDLVVDESRGRLYIVDTTQNRIDVYSTAQKRFLNPIPVGTQPLSAAISRDGARLYVTIYSSSALEVVDLDSATVVRRVSLPASPEGVAVGGDERVLITTLGSGASNAENRLLLYDPNLAGEDALRAVATTLPAPTTPTTTITSSRVYMSTRSNLTASADGRWIIGLNNPSASSRQMFVFEVASGSMLRSRTLTSISNVLSVSPNGDRFMAGLSLFDAGTLAITAQQNTANSMYPFPNNANFSTQSNQGGSVFAPDLSVVYSAFNIAPVTTTGAATNTSQLLLSDPDNLLIRLGIQLPENLTGKMVITSDGATIYALSQSGFIVIPISTLYDNPIASIESPALLLAYDQCGVTSSKRTGEVVVRNIGKGRLTATAQVNTSSAVTFTFPIAGQQGVNIAVPPTAGGGGFGGIPIGGGGPGGGAGAGAPGGAFPIILPQDPTTGAGGGQIMIPPGAAGFGGAAGAGGAAFDPRGSNLSAAQQTGVSSAAPTLTTRRTDTETIFQFAFNSNAAKSLGTQAPTDFLVQAAEAIKIPVRIRAYQNYRNAEANGDVKTAPTSVSTSEGLVDMVMDSARQRLYIANSGLNRVEVFDTRANRFLTPIKAGQLPRSLAMTPNGKLLYVANSGGESIGIIDLDKGEVTGKVRFPPVNYNASYALNTPSVIVATLSGLQVVMSDGTLWKVVNDEAMPRKSGAVLGTSAITSPRTMVATPGGEYALLLGGSGTAYLYDASADDFVLSQSVVATPIQGYFGPLAAGPRGQYYVVNGTVLNSSLTPLSASSVGGGPGGFPGLPVSATTGSAIAAVAAVDATTIARFSQPARASANAAVTETPAVQLVNAATSAMRGSSPVLEGPLSSQVGNQRVNVNGRTMAVDPAGATAYVLTTSGLSIVPLGATQQIQFQPGAALPSTMMLVNQNGVVNTANYQASFAPGSLVSIFGQNLGTEASAATSTLPSLMGGVCVTMDDKALPLFMTSPSQINLQIPPDTKAGTHTLLVRSPERYTSGMRYSISVKKYAPAVFLNAQTGQAAVYRANGTPVGKSAKAKRDESLTLYATGLGVTQGGKVTAGAPAPSSPLAVTDKVQVFFGDPDMKQSEMIVDWSGLTPGQIGIYQINLRVPGFHEKGDALPVTVRIGGVDSPTTGANVPTVAVE